jgi:hypothetical protein
MKKINLITCAIITLVYAKVSSQNIIIRGIDNGNLPENFKSTGNYYYKDVYNYLDWFVGTWEYVNGNEKFQIVLTKVINYHNVDTYLNFDFNEDGIVLQYRKYINNQLIFESPLYEDPDFDSEDGNELKGSLFDYGRLTKTLYKDEPFNTQVWIPGGTPMPTLCFIKKHPLENNKIKFSLNFFESHSYDAQAYAGQPVYSIPNNIVMTKVN